MNDSQEVQVLRRRSREEAQQSARIDDSEYREIRYESRRSANNVRHRSSSSRARSPMEKSLPRREHNFVREQTDDNDNKHGADNLRKK